MSDPKSRILNGLAFFVCLVPMVLFSTLWLKLDWIPAHDTLGHIMHSKLFMDHFLASGEFSLWGPYTDFGRNARINIPTEFHPSLVFLLPWLKAFPAVNALEAFYVSMLFSEAILLLGCFKLARLLYSSRWTAVFVCLSLTGTVVWVRQFYYNFQIYYTLPLIFYYFLKGARESSVKQIAIGFALLSISSFLGLPAYNLIMIGIFCLVFLLAALGVERQGTAILRNPWRQYLWLLLPLGMTLLFAGYLGINSEYMNALGRGPQGHVTLEVMLSWGGTDAGDQAFLGLLFGQSSYGDFTVYCGFFIIPLALFALFRFERQQIPFLAANGFLFLIYAGKNSFMAPLLYLLPPFDLFRHVMHMAPTLRIGLVFLAGFGFERLFQILAGQHAADKPKDLRILFYAFVLLYLVFLWGWQHGSLSSGGMLLLLLQTLWLLLLARLIWGDKAFKINAVLAVALILVGVDVWSFRVGNYLHRHSGINDINNTGVPDLFQFMPLEYQPERFRDFFRSEHYHQLGDALYSATNRMQTGFADCVVNAGTCGHSINPKFGVVYHGIEQAMGFDPCFQFFRSDLTGERVRRLNYFAGLAPTLNDARNRNIIRELYGCDSPKIRFFPNLSLVNDSSHYLGHLEDPEEKNLGVFFMETGDWRIAGQPAAPVSGAMLQPVLPIHHRVTSFSPNQIVIEGRVPLDQGPTWLYYADAWHPDWHARLNGKEVQILPANLAFKAVLLQPGPFKLEMNFDSTRMEWMIALMFLIAFVYMLFICLMIYQCLQGRGDEQDLPNLSFKAKHA